MPRGCAGLAAVRPGKENADVSRRKTAGRESGSGTTGGI